MHSYARSLFMIVGILAVPHLTNRVYLPDELSKFVLLAPFETFSKHAGLLREGKLLVSCRSPPSSLVLQTLKSSLAKLGALS